MSFPLDTQQLDRLRGEGHDVPLAHVHTLSGNPPFRRIEIKFRPLGAAQLARPNENQRCELQSNRSRRVAIVDIDRAE